MFLHGGKCLGFALLTTIQLKCIFTPVRSLFSPAGGEAEQVLAFCRGVEYNTGRRTKSSWIGVI